MELVERCENILGQVKALCERERPREIVVADLGDICEGTNNHTSTSQASTNDLPQSEQLRVAGRILMEYVTTLAPLCAHLTLAGVRSNHGEERLANGQVNGVGDWGVALIKTIGDAVVKRRGIGMTPDRMGEQLVCMTLDDLVRLLLD